MLAEVLQSTDSMAQSTEQTWMVGFGSMRSILCLTHLFVSKSWVVGLINTDWPNSQWVLFLNRLN